MCRINYLWSAEDLHHKLDSANSPSPPVGKLMHLQGRDVKTFTTRRNVPCSQYQKQCITKTLLLLNCT